MYFWQQYQENFKIAEYPLHQFIHLVDHLEIRIALSNPNIDVRILAQGAYCVAIISLSLLWTWQWDEIHKALLIKQETEWIEWLCSFLLISPN